MLVLLGWLATEPQGVTCFYLYEAGITSRQHHVWHMDMLHGHEFVSSCVHGKHLTDGIISTVPVCWYPVAVFFRVEAMYVASSPSLPNVVTKPSYCVSPLHATIL